MDEFNNKPLVSIQCLVYNHEPFLRQCLDGFVMQKTTFPFEAIIHDDVSSDSSAAIIREYADKYPDIIKPVFESENQYSINGFYKLMNIMNDASNGKYVAYCEGDDYWIDPYKLQKQVDYLEAHPECGLVYTNSMIYDQAKDELFRASLPKQSDFINLLLESPIMTLTTCFRRDLFSDFIKNIRPRSTWLMGDLPTWLYIASQSQIKYLPDVTSVYRILENSASHPLKMEKSTDFCLSSFYIRKFYAAKFGKQNMIKQICINHINELFKISFSFDKSVSHIASQLARDNSVYSPKTWIKIIIYSSSLGRRVHVIKNSNSI